jgi:L-2,4-diaminobutyrate decarboxylase
MGMAADTSPCSPPALAAAFDPEAFRRQGHAVVDLLADHLAAAHQRAGAVLPWEPPEAQRQRWARPFAAGGEGEAALHDTFAAYLAATTTLHHPRFTGHQVTPPLPAAALADLVAAFANSSGAVYEMGPAAMATELAVLRWMATTLGLEPGADGLLTSGGSLGNLTALLAARRAAAGFDAWRDGYAAGPPLAILATDGAHYSVARAAQIMGLGTPGIVTVPTDARLRLDAAALGPVLDAATRDGRRVFAVVASACTTAAGIYDPLEAVADFCRARGLWLHVDGAHGAGAALSPRYRHLVAGIERADSLVWDAHKMLLVPSLVTGVLFREGERSWTSFSQEAAYLLGSSGAEEWYNLSHRTVECTKNAMSLKLYATLRTAGPALLAAHVERAYDLARWFAALLEEAGDFELAAPPESNIVCFRHAPAGIAASQLDALQAHIRRRIIESGAFYLVQARLRGRLYLRTTLMNPLTEEDDLRQLLDAVRDAARQEPRR